MAVAAAWMADPTGRHQLRYWDGNLWTEHVSDAGAVSSDPLAPGGYTPAAAGGWMDKVKVAAQQAVDTTSAAVDTASDAAKKQWDETQARRAAANAAAAAPVQGQPPVAPAATSAAVADPVPEQTTVADQLLKLADLRDRGVLTEQEFATQKAKILDA